jgi:hypothetical protein
MADLREAFPILEDLTGAGVAPSKSENGDASAGKVGATVWAFKDASGNLVHPQLTPDGRIPMTQDAAGTFRNAKGELASGSATFADVTGASLTLAPSKTFVKLSAMVSCFREAIFQITQINDASTTILAEIVIGPGQYTFTWTQPDFEISSGSTGTQTLKVVGKNLDKLSSLRATITCVEVSA